MKHKPQGRRMAANDPRVQNDGMPQTTKDRQESLRARRAMLGQTEVRGIYLPPELHAKLKEMAKILSAKNDTQNETKPEKV